MRTLENLMPPEKLIYMAHPVRGDVAANRLRAMLWLKWLTLETKAVVIAPWITDVALWDDGDEHQREHGLMKCRATLVRCDELWMVGGKGASDGMRREVSWAMESGLKIVDASMMPAPWESGRWSLVGDPMALEILVQISQLRWAPRPGLDQKEWTREVLGEPVPPLDVGPLCKCTIPRSDCGRCLNG